MNAFLGPATSPAAFSSLQCHHRFFLGRAATAAAAASTFKV